MKIVMVSNYFNHHQKPLSDAFYARIGDDYTFIETTTMSAERLALGWGMNEKPSYVKQAYTDDEAKKACQRLLDEADVVIYGSAPYELIEPRLKVGKLTFRYSERIYKDGIPYLKLWRHYIIHRKKFGRYKNCYLLAASAYAPVDYARLGTFKGKAYKWGYFTAVKAYDDVDKLIDTKKPASILWGGRLIGLKHPETAIEVAKHLKRDGYSFTLNMIGTGEMEEDIKAQIASYGLDDCVHMLGSMTPDRVRTYMEESEIFLFTSDKGEGWGAVLNESMNSACAVVASHAIGSVPFLAEDGKNALIYKSEDVDDLCAKVKLLLDDKETRRSISKEAYLTMKNEWCPANAARKLIENVTRLLAGEKAAFSESGVCSPAEILRDDWKK